MDPSSEAMEQAVIQLQTSGIQFSVKVVFFYFI